MTDLDWPTGRYAAVTVDPPWAYGTTQRLSGRHRRSQAAMNRYATMNVGELTQLDVGGLLEDGGHLWLWVTNTGIAEGWHLPLLDAWQVRPVTVLTWIKGGAPNLGRYARGTTEHAILAVKGWGGVPAAPYPHTHFNAAKTTHSQKPPAFADIVESLKPGGPWCELFARNQRLGWDTWGHGWETAS